MLSPLYARGALDETFLAQKSIESSESSMVIVCAAMNTSNRWEIVSAMARSYEGAIRLLQIWSQESVCW